MSIIRLTPRCNFLNRNAMLDMQLECTLCIFYFPIQLNVTYFNAFSYFFFLLHAIKIIPFNVIGSPHWRNQCCVALIKPEPCIIFRMHILFNCILIVKKFYQLLSARVWAAREVKNLHVSMYHILFFVNCQVLWIHWVVHIYVVVPYTYLYTYFVHIGNFTLKVLK